jgi:predicted transcriptional regulator
MPRPASPTLTEAELRLMKVLWSLGAATPAEVLKALPREPALAESTVRTILGILRDKGYVLAEPRGRAFTYRPVVDRAEAGRSAVRELVRRFFEGSPRDLVLSVLGDGELDAAEVARLREIIDREDEEGRDG